MVWAAGLPGSEESSSAHESCCRGIGAKLSWAWGGGKHFHKGLFCSAEVLWRSCRLKQSIRDHSIIITPRESWCRAAHTLQHVHRLLHPSLRLFFFFSWSSWSDAPFHSLKQPPLSSFSPFLYFSQLFPHYSPVIHCPLIWSHGGSVLLSPGAAYAHKHTRSMHTRPHHVGDW